ncbi:MAG: hypothetical protein HQL94_08805 [Magnetococcales bacterium]|nr:hypothetical protein [Magnetococcales bacterium]MBF0429006.1 hypothetical protein [Magnetococcales bacterium]
MTIKQIIRPDRLRQVPKQFNWVDHRLVRDGYICRCGHAEWALYLFLVTVGDCQGLSYYSDRSIQKLLSMDPETLVVARQKLVQADMIAFAPPLYQVLSLEPKNRMESIPYATEKREMIRTCHNPEAMKETLRRLWGIA